MLLKRTILSLLLLAVATLQLHAQAQVSLSSAQGHPGDELELVLSLKGGEAVTALEATIALPAALSYVEGSAQLNTGRVAPSHQIAATQADGLLKLYVYSTALDLLKSQDGELLRFRLLLGREPSAYTLQPAVVLSNKAGNAVACTAVAGTVTLLSPKIALSEQTIDFGRVPIRSTYTRTFNIYSTFGS